MTRRIPADAPLRNMRERNVGLALSDPLSARLDALVDVVEATGERTNRKELLSALILGASPDVVDLPALVHRYRIAVARDALIEADPAASVLVFPARGPGPRRRS